MALVKEQFEFMLDLARLVFHAHDLGFIVTGGELFRTPEQQDIYVRSGRSKTFNSMHLKRLAIDLNFFDVDSTVIYDKDKLQPLGTYWENLNSKNKWGGNWHSFKDLPHFERRV